MRISLSFVLYGSPGISSRTTRFSPPFPACCCVHCRTYVRQFQQLFQQPRRGIDPSGEGCGGMVRPLEKGLTIRRPGGAGSVGTAPGPLRPVAPLAGVGGRPYKCIHLYRYPPTSLAPRLGGARPAALAADGRLPQIAGDFPPGTFSAWAAPNLTVSPSAAAAAAAGYHGSHDTTLCTSGGERRSPGRRAGIKKQALRLVATAGGPGPFWSVTGCTG